MRALTRITASAPTASVAGPQRTGRVLVHGEVARMVGVTPRIWATWLGWRGSTCGISRTTAPSAGNGPRLRTRTVTETTWPTWLTRGRSVSLTARSAPPASEGARTRSGPGSGWGGPGGSGGCGGTGGSGPGSGGSGGTASYWLVTATLWRLLVRDRHEGGVDGSAGAERRGLGDRVVIAPGDLADAHRPGLVAPRDIHGRLRSGDERDGLLEQLPPLTTITHGPAGGMPSPVTALLTTMLPPHSSPVVVSTVVGPEVATM